MLPLPQLLSVLLQLATLSLVVLALVALAV
jgi:hypothetical protein